MMYYNKANYNQLGESNHKISLCHRHTNAVMTGSPF